MKTLRKLVILVGLIAIGALGIAFFSLNAVIKKGFETAGSSVAKVETKLGSASILPFKGSGTLNKIFIGNPEGYRTPHAIQVNAVKMGLNLPSIKSDTVIIDFIDVHAPDIYIEGGLTGKNNLTAIANNMKSSTEAPKKPKTDEPKNASGSKSAKETGKKIVVKKLRITGAQVRWVSTLTLGQEISLPLPDISLNNIGEERQGITMSEFSQLVMNEIFKAASTVTSQNTGKAVEQLKATGAKNLEKAAGGLKGLLQK